MADIFISYARPERDRIASLSAALEQAGWTVWWDRHIDGGSAFARAIEKELEASRAVVVAWSQAALQSDWVKDEAATARDQGKLVPVSLDGAVAPLGFRQYHVIDLSAWNGESSAPAFADLVRSLEARLGGGTPLPPRSVTPPTPPTAEQAGRPAATRPRNFALAGLALLGLLGVVALVLRGEAPGSDAPVTTATGSGSAAVTASAAAPAASAEPEAARDKSIAVLPFANRSARAEDAYFAEGMHDDLLAQLSRIGDLRVTSRTSVMRYADTEKPIPEIATELGVGVVLEGGVQRAGDRVRINVQLIDGRTDTHLWAETFDRELTVENLFDIQSEITRAIATALKSVLVAPAKLLPEQLPTQSTEAYNAYLRGNTLNRYEEHDPDLIRRAAQAYGEAVAIDPRFAAAHARKAVAHLTLAWWGVDVAENTRLAEQALDRARTLAPQSNGTRVAEGYYRYWVKNDYAGADAAVRAALEQSPQDAGLWRLHGATARRAGDMSGSISAWERVLAIDPKDADAAANLAVNHAYLGRLADARRWLSRSWALSPDSNNPPTEAIVLSLSGDVDATWRRYEELRTRADSDPVSPFSGLATTLRDPARLEVFAARLTGEQFPGLFGLETGLARALALDRLGHTAEARALAQHLKVQLARVVPVNADHGRRARILAIALDAFLGNATAAREGAAALKKDPPRDHLWIIEMAPPLMAAHARIGEPDAAFDLVEQAMDRFSPVHFVTVKNDVAFDAYRELPRYRKLDGRYGAWKAAQPSAG